jgi:hypothetical protein
LLPAATQPASALAVKWFAHRNEIIMARSAVARVGSAPPRKRRTGSARSRFTTLLAGLWPRARTRRRLMRRFGKAPPIVQGFAVGLLLVVVAFAVNGIYQVVRKPTELYFPVSGVLSKAPAATWRSYGSLFRSHSTVVVAPELLAALAQVEGAGNPVARTYWRWRLTPAPFEMYRPASSAVGMYQLTDAAFADARRFCVRDHVVVEDGPWNDWNSCWFNGLYTRVVPTHAVELTSVLLDRGVTRVLAHQRIRNASLQQKQDLAALIHLCGAGTAEAYARRGLRLAAGERCGDHDAAAYLARVNAAKREFTRLAAND